MIIEKYEVKEIIAYILLFIVGVFLFMIIPYLLWKISLHELGISFKKTFSFNFVIILFTTIILGGKK